MFLSCKKASSLCNPKARFYIFHTLSDSHTNTHTGTFLDKRNRRSPFVKWNPLYWDKEGMQDETFGYTHKETDTIISSGLVLLRL